MVSNPNGYRSIQNELTQFQKHSQNIKTLDTTRLDQSHLRYHSKSKEGVQSHARTHQATKPDPAKSLHHEDVGGQPNDH